MTAALQTRVRLLEQVYSDIARTRMAGVAMLNDRVHVAAVEFAALDSEVALGVLITPWFMNLVRLPLTRSDAEEASVGHKVARVITAHSIEFTIAHDPALGFFECCSLFSPLLEFTDHDAVVATARAALRMLEAGSPDATPALHSRRALLLGRRTSEARK
jgi:[NiFe] hydrogenase assembly HybE family chaperone